MPPSNLPQEKMLYDQIVRVGKWREGRLGVCIHFSRLSSAYRRKHFTDIAQDSFTSYVSGFEGIIYPLKNGDIFFLTKDVTLSSLEVAVNRVKRLFSQDPLVEKHTPEGKSLFCTYYDLEKDYDTVLIWIKELVNLAEAEERKPKIVTPELLQARLPIGPDILAKLQVSLRSVDMTNIARRQTVCTLIEGEKPQPLFEEIYISIDTLRNLIIPDVDIFSNKWLFRHLTSTLDYRLMEMLIRDGVKSSRPFSLNLNVSTILSPDFARFESIITPQLRGRLVIEVHNIDVLSDYGAFLFARDYLRDRGFRICLDSLTHQTVPFFDRGKYNFDLFKISWTPQGLDILLPSSKPIIRNTIMDIGQAHVILCHCDEPRAIELGQELGIVMFQGYEVDKVMSSSNVTFDYKF